MRIATFNLESLDSGPHAPVPLAERIEALRPQLERLEADILCLQEVHGQRRPHEEERAFDALDGLLAGTQYAPFLRAASSGTHGEGVADVHNLVTLSRWPILANRAVRHGLVPPMTYRMLTATEPHEAADSIGFERPLLVTDIETPGGRTLTVINLHLRAPLATPIPGQKEAPFVWKSISGWAEGFLLSAWKRAAQALETRLVVDQILTADPHRDIVVAGDFNAEDHETPLRLIMGAEEDTGNGHLVPRSLVMLDRSLSQDRRFSVLHHGRPQMLDHILATRALVARFRGIEVHNETLSDEAAGLAATAHMAGSYHAPVVATFS